MTEELHEAKMVEDQEEGEILEDGEIADDEEDIVPLDSGNGPTKDEKESGEGTKDKLTHYSSYFSSDRDDYFRPHKRRKKNHPKKRKRGSSVDAKRKDRELIDINPYLNDTSFDNVELSDEEEYHFEQLHVNLILEILGCSIEPGSLAQVAPNERPKVVVRIVKIMKKLYGNDPDTAKRMVRLKRRAVERRNSLNGKSSGFKVPCKFYVEGKCHKGVDCNYSHDCPVPRKKELCKFFLQGKGEDCLYMHGEFPCKFFHTNTKCFSGDKCRFSHAPLTPENREILRGYLDFGTFPDEYKAFQHRSSGHNSNEWASSKNDEASELDVNELDIEQLLAKSRPVIIGEPTEKMKKSYGTWKWQQELKDCEEAYTGVKRNLFCIEEKHVIKEKPASPKIEEDEEEIEAQIRNYYTDILDADEYEEMIAIQEIEEHQRKLKEEGENKKSSEVGQVVEPSPVLGGMSEEEKRLIEASAHDEDLRMLPHSFSLPPAFQNAPPAVPNIAHTPFESSYTHNNYFPPENFTPPFKPFSSNEGDATSNEPQVPVNEITTSDVNSLVHQIRHNGSASEPLSAPLLPTPSMPPISIASSTSPVSVNPPPVTTSKPELRDPRLQRLKESGRPVLTPTSVNTGQEDKTLNKPFIKVCNPHVIIDYKLVLVKVSQINYSIYTDLYHNDNTLKNDPRLKKFFTNSSSTSAINESISGDSNSNEFFTSFKAANENLQTLPSLNLTMSTMSTSNPQLISKVPAPQEVPNSTQPSTSLTASIINISRDPRMRPKDPRARGETNEQPGEMSPAVSAQKPLVSGLCEQPEEKTNGDNGDDTREETSLLGNVSQVGENATPSEKALSSMPSYAIAALPATRSLLATLPINLIYSPSEEQGNNVEASLKVDRIEELTLPNNSSQATTLEETNEKWTINTENGIDSDNEMEIDLQQHESEGDSENESELIIATSSDPEDKECDGQSSSDQLSLCKGDYSVNC